MVRYGKEKQIKNHNLLYYAVHSNELLKYKDTPRE